MKLPKKELLVVIERRVLSLRLQKDGFVNVVVDGHRVVEDRQVHVIVAQRVGQDARELAQAQQRERREEDADDGVVVTEHGVRVGDQDEVDEEDEVEDVEEGEGDGHRLVVVQSAHVSEDLWEAGVLEV